MRRRTHRDNSPREITAKYDSQCAETGKEIKKGDTCLYWPMYKKVYHVDSETAQDWRSAQAARAFNLADANW